MKFKKPCLDCGKLFRPDGKYQRFCENCLNNPKHTGGRLKFEDRIKNLGVKND